MSPVGDMTFQINLTSMRVAIFAVAHRPIHRSLQKVPVKLLYLPFYYIDVHKDSVVDLTNSFVI